MKRFLSFAVVVLLACISVLAQTPPGGYGPGGGSGGGGSSITPVATLPATCTAGTSPPVQLTGSITVGQPPFSYGPGTVFYCDSTNHYSPVSQGSGAAPNLGTYYGPQCPPSNQAQCVFAVADTQTATDCGWTTSNGVIVCTSSHFVAADVGKSVMGAFTFSGDVLNTQQSSTVGAIAPNAAMPTITAFNSGTSVTISATPVNACTISAGPPAGCGFLWGHIDDTTAASLHTLLNASLICPKVFLAAANYLFTTPPAFMFTQYPGCLSIGPLTYSGALGAGLGTTELGAGYELEGRGTGPTAVYLSTNFPNGDTCQHNPNSLQVGTPINVGACFAIPVSGKWSDFRIDGAGQGNPTGLSNKTLIRSATGTIANLTCLNYGGYIGGSIGFEIQTLTQLYQVNNSGCGAVNFALDTNSASSIGFRVTGESAGADPLFIAGSSGSTIVPNFECFGCIFANANSQPLGAAATIQNNGGYIKLFGSRLATFNSNSGANTNNGIITYKCGVAGGILYAESTSFEGSSGGASNTNGGIAHTAACTDYLLQDSILSQSGSFDVLDVAGSKEFDLGGNIFTPRVSIAGNVFGSTSITGNPQTAGNFAISPASSATFGTISGSSTRGQVTLTWAGTPSTTETITMTFPTPFLVAPVCTLTDVGGTNAIPTSIVNGTISATSAVFNLTFLAAPTVGNTDIFIWNCGN